MNTPRSNPGGNVTKTKAGTTSVTNIITVESFLSRADNKFDVIRFILGGENVIERPIRSEMDLIDLAKDGVKRASILSVCRYLDVSMEKMGEILHVSPRTLQRKSDDNVLGVYSSEQAIEVAALVGKGIQVLGSEEKFRLWLNSPLPALNYKQPLDFLDTSFGIDMLVDELIRLEQGVFS